MKVKYCYCKRPSISLSIVPTPFFKFQSKKEIPRFLLFNKKKTERSYLYLTFFFISRFIQKGFSLICTTIYFRIFLHFKLQKWLYCLLSTQGEDSVINYRLIAGDI